MKVDFAVPHVGSNLGRYLTFMAETEEENMVLLQIAHALRDGGAVLMHAQCPDVPNLTYVMGDESLLAEVRADLDSIQ